MTSSSVAVIAVTLVCSGCQSGWGMQEYRAAVRSGRPLIASAMEMEKQFSKTEHMLIQYGASRNTAHEWQTVSFFGGRYTLTMSTSVGERQKGTLCAGINRFGIENESILRGKCSQLLRPSAEGRTGRPFCLERPCEG